MLSTVLLAIVPLLTLVKADIDPTKAYIKPKAYPNKCVVAPNQQTDSPIVLMDCVMPRYGSSQAWTKQPAGEKGLLRWGDTFCLDAGLDPQNGSAVKLWECDESGEWPQQQWLVKEDGTVEGANGQCLNVKRESEEGKEELQTWACAAEDPQGQFFVGPWEW